MQYFSFTSYKFNKEVKINSCYQIYLPAYHDVINRSKKISNKTKLLLWQFLLIPYCIFAADLGVVAKTFDITEQSFTAMMQQRLKAISKDKMEQHKRNIINTTRARINRPKGTNLPRVTTKKVFKYNPSITTRRDISHDGKVLISKGTTVNPFDFISLSKPIIFFDGDDAKQLAWARLQQGTLVITSGSPFDVAKDLEKRVYFDQMGKMTEKFGIQFLPARVIQSGHELQIEEVLL